MVSGDPGGGPSDTQPWSGWRQTVFGDPYLVWHDGPDFTNLLAAAKSDPGTVMRMLAAGFAECDPLAAESISTLARAALVPEDSQALLLGALPDATGTFLVRVAQALYTVTGDPSWSAPIAAVLGEDRFWGERIDAAMALAGFAPSRDLVGALSQAVCDPEYLVRYHAANTLLRYAGRSGDVADRAVLFDKIKSPASGAACAADRLGWKAAADLLVSMVLPRHHLDGTQDHLRWRSRE